MLPNISPSGKSFIGAGAYHLHDKHAPSAQRVLFTATRNLANDDAHAALHEMTRTAFDAPHAKAFIGNSQAGRKNTTPVKTISLAWAPHERPSQTQMIAADTFGEFYRQSGYSGSAPGEGLTINLTSAGSRNTARYNVGYNATVADGTIGIFAGRGGDNVVADNAFINFKTGLDSYGSPGHLNTLTNNFVWIKEPLPDSLGIEGTYSNASRNRIIGFGIPTGDRHEEPTSPPITHTDEVIHPALSGARESALP